MTPTKAPTTDERRALHRLKLLSQEYRKVYVEMPVQMQLTLLTIAENPGLTLSEIAKLAGLGLASVSRHFEILGPANTAKNVGLGLLVGDYDAMDRRKKVINLTPKGAAVIDTLIHLIQPQA